MGRNRDTASDFVSNSPSVTAESEGMQGSRRFVRRPGGKNSPFNSKKIRTYIALRMNIKSVNKANSSQLSVIRLCTAPGADG